MDIDHDQFDAITPIFNTDAPMLQRLRQTAIAYGNDRELWKLIGQYEFACIMFFRAPEAISVEEMASAYNDMARRCDDLTGEPSCRLTVEFLIRQREEVLAMWRPMESDVVH